MKRSAWQGPVYMFRNHWQSDLVAVMEQIRLCIKANVPLSPGFDMVARDGLEAYKSWSPQFSTRLFKFAAFMFFIVSALMTLVFSIQSDGPVPGIATIKVIVLCVWCYLSVYRRYWKPMAIFLCLKEHIDAGHTLSEAMARLPRFFPKNLVCLIEAGERTGRLEEILTDFNDETVKAIASQRNLARTFRYLGMNFLAVIAIASFALVKSVPVMMEILSELDVPREALTRDIWIPVPSLYTVTHTVDFLIFKWPVTLAILLASGAGLWIWWRRKRSNWTGHSGASIWLAVPGLRGMVVWQNLGDAARLMRYLLGAGVPLEQCLAMVARGDINPWYRKWFEVLRTDITSGLSLEVACAKRANPKLIPQSFGALLRLGESQGNLMEALDWIGTQYREKLERRTQFLLGCVLPAGVFVLGYLVLTIEASVFQTLISLTDALIE